MTITCGVLRTVAFIILSAFLCAPRAHGAGVVSTCDEAHFLAALNGGGSVTFSCAGVITLTHSTPIEHDTAIDGGGMVTLTGLEGGLYTNCGPIALGPFVTPTCGLVLSNITMQHFSLALANKNQVFRVSNTMFINNNNHDLADSVGGAIYNGGQLYVHDCYFFLNGADNGGAIYSNGSLVVGESTFFLNNAQKGGAIYSKTSPMYISNSTFTDNGSLTGSGGNIYFEFSAGLSEISNSTLNAGRGGPGQPGNLFAGSVSQGTGSLIVVNTIMANPGLPAGNCGGTVLDGGGNLQWPASGSPCVGAVADPKLGPLANNGGNTMTMALMPGSAAINKGFDPLCTPADQRHVLRPQGPHCDIGAYEDIPTMIQFIGGLGRNFGNFAPLVPGTGAGTLTRQVISPLARSQDATLWQADGNHLNPQRGEQVFDLHQSVVNNLAELIVDQTQLDYISNLVFADRALAAAAMSPANCGAAGAASPTGGKCAQAASELAKGDSSSATGNYGEAIGHYKSAWSYVTSPSSHD